MDTPSPYTIDEWLSYMILRGLADEGERGTLLACRLASKIFYPVSTSLLFREVNILEGRRLQGFAAVLSRETLGRFVQILVIGQQERGPAHGHLPRTEINPIDLATILDKLPSLRLLKLVWVVWKTPFILKSPTPMPGVAPSSHLLLLSKFSTTPLLSLARGVSADSFADNTRIALPADSAGAHRPQHGPQRGLPKLGLRWVQGMSIGEGGSPQALAHLAACPPAHDGMVFYGGSMEAWERFGELLTVWGVRMKTLELRWSSSRIILGCGAMARYMVPAIASCTSLQSLALSLFVNPLAAASMEEQWQDIIALASAANPATLRSFTLVVNGGGLSFDKEVMSRFQRLDWSALVSSFRRTRCSEMASVAPAYGSQSATGVRVEVSSYGLLLLDSGRHLYAEHRTTTGSPATFKTHIPSGTMSFSDRKAMGEFSE